MPRPSTPLISRRHAVSVSIELLDQDGLEAFSLPRLAKALGVRAPSLYHHFADKNELLTEVSRAIIASTPVPASDPNTPWRDWIVQLCLNTRSTILQHRGAAMVVLRFLPRDTLTQLYEQAADVLAENGVPVRDHVLILDGLERLTIGATAAEALRPVVPRNRIFPNVTKRVHPRLRAALEANERPAEALFEDAVRAFLLGVTGTD